jgi:hypothetical protein
LCNIQKCSTVSEHKHHDNTATNANSKNTGSRKEAILRGSIGTGTEEDGSSAGHVWAAGFHHVRARSRLAHVLKIMKFISLIFKFFSSCGKPQISETADTESADTGA